MYLKSKLNLVPVIQRNALLPPLPFVQEKGGVAGDSSSAHDMLIKRQQQNSRLWKRVLILGTGTLRYFQPYPSHAECNLSTAIIVQLSDDIVSYKGQRKKVIYTLSQINSKPKMVFQCHQLYFQSCNFLCRYNSI